MANAGTIVLLFQVFGQFKNVGVYGDRVLVPQIALVFITLPKSVIISSKVVSASLRSFLSEFYLCSGWPFLNFDFLAWTIVCAHKFVN